MSCSTNFDDVLIQQHFGKVHTLMILVLISWLKYYCWYYQGRIQRRFTVYALDYSRSTSTHVFLIIVIAWAQGRPSTTNLLHSQYLACCTSRDAITDLLWPCHSKLLYILHCSYLKVLTTFDVRGFTGTVTALKHTKYVHGFKHGEDSETFPGFVCVPYAIEECTR